MKSKLPCFAHLGAQQFELKVFCSKGKQSWINAPFTLVDFHFLLLLLFTLNNSEEKFTLVC